MKTRRGFALIVTLALIVLVSFAVIAYFSRAIANRRIESATSSAVRADTVVRAASEIIVGDIRTEIAGGSSISQPAGQMPICSPTDSAKMVPARSLVTTAMLTDAVFTNLVKQSGDRFYPTAGYDRTPIITTSTGRSTAVPSANGKLVTQARWNAPVLNTSSGFDSDDKLPRWILADRQGVAPSQVWSDAFRDYTPGNDNAIIGRFAFNLYDTGGLLDASLAGNPIYTPALSDPQIQQLKSTQTGATLDSIIPGFDTARQTAFVNVWKFSSNSSSNFFDDFMNVSPTFADSGFMRPTVRSSTSSNSIPFSRQDLLRATIASSAYITTASLPYITHFSRELNAPSWTPSNPTGSTIDYASQAELPAAANRDIPNVRVKASFIRADGTTTVVGEPLIKNRFPLRRLDSIGFGGVNPSAFPVMVAGILQAPSATTTSSYTAGTTVQRDFGLIWNSANNRWDYVGATGTTVQSAISTLDQVATANREPNLFELLKACILSGSIGLGTDNSGTGRTIVDAEPRYYQQPLSNDSEIIQIGANIIDQWDSDKNPTFINFAGNELAGIENLPYLNKVGFQCRWSTATTPVFSAFLVPQFWTPAQNATAVGTQNTTTIPAVRFVMTSGTVTAVVESATATATSATVTGSATSPSANLTQSANFGPTPNAASSATTVKSGMSGTANSKLGITLTFSAMNGVTKATTVRAYPKMDKAVFEMQVQIGGTSAAWKTYQRWFDSTVNLTGTTAACEPAAGFDWTQTTIYDPEFVLLDPRTMRFGVWQTDGKNSGNTTDFARGVVETLDRVTPDFFQAITGLGPQGSSFTGVGAQMANNTTASPGYIDLDGIRRRGDYLTAVTTTSALLPTNFADRPPGLGGSLVVSGRQIRTVAELGAVFRDQPWKTLNFSTADSGDAGLLDAFTIFEPNSVFRSDITAGKLSLNTRQPLVLSAILAGTATATSTSTLPLISPGQRDAVANALVAMTTAQPMINKSELVTRFAADPSVTALGNKEAREAVIRALSDVGQTRTWNLMIDVIAQSGRYGQQAASVDDFIVEGEKRYWLHVAIDRFTGEVVDRQLEAVHE